MKTKYCPDCDKEVSIKLFGIWHPQYDGLSKLCLKHTAEQRRQYRKLNAAKLQERLDRLRMGVPA